VGGEVITLTPKESRTHPLEYQGNFLLSPGVPTTVEVQVTSDSEENEGWSRIRFRLEITAAF